MTRDATDAQKGLLLGLLFGTFAALAVFANLPAGLWSKDLARGKPWRTSSTQVVCAPAHHSCGGAPTDIFFHTSEEDSPWFEVDLGEPRRVSQLRIDNRRDCCSERAVPLVIEVAQTPGAWREVARHEQPFQTFEPKLETPQEARYVRLRVARRSTLHLEAVEVFP